MSTDLKENLCDFKIQCLRVNILFSSPWFLKCVFSVSEKGAVFLLKKKTFCPEELHQKKKEKIVIHRVLLSFAAGREKKINCGNY